MVALLLRLGLWFYYGLRVFWPAFFDWTTAFRMQKISVAYEHLRHFCINGILAIEAFVPSASAYISLSRGVCLLDILEPSVYVCSCYKSRLVNLKYNLNVWFYFYNTRVFNINSTARVSVGFKLKNSLCIPSVGSGAEIAFCWTAIPGLPFAIPSNLSLSSYWQLPLFPRLWQSGRRNKTPKREFIVENNPCRISVTKIALCIMAFDLKFGAVSIL